LYAIRTVVRAPVWQRAYGVSRPTGMLVCPKRFRITSQAVMC
jgi:hypothetical protein